MIAEQAMALLRVAVETGFLSAAAEPHTSTEVAAATALPDELASDLCAALHAFEILERDGRHYHLSDSVRALLSSDAPQNINNTLALSETYACLLRQAFANHPVTPGPEQHLTLSKGIWGLPTSSIALASFADVDQVMPEVRDLWTRGARHLELGCGAGRDLLHIAVLYPATSVVGVDVDALSLEEVRRAAVDLGIQNRVEVRLADARDFVDHGGFDTVTWSQMFFQIDARPGAIATIRRVLKPDGYLIMPIQHERPEAEKALRTVQGKRLALMKVLYRSWGCGSITSEAARAELEMAGFRCIRVVPHQRTPYMLMQLANLTVS
jgi:SAM-dependent methyltransferase